MGCIFLLYFPMKWPKIGKALTFGLVMLFTASSVFLYHYKKDSADGRLLIWQCTWNMIKERPLYGYGYGGYSYGYGYRHREDSDSAANAHGREAAHDADEAEGEERE